MTANTAQRVDVERLTDALATAAELGRTADRLARVGGGEWSDAYHAHRAECVALVRDHGPDISALLLQVAELEEYRRLSDEANGTLKAMCAVAESKLAEQAAEIETRREDYATLSALWKADEAKYRARAEAAERAREEACGLLGIVVSEVDNYRDSVSMATYNRIAAFLAANGGSNG